MILNIKASELYMNETRSRIENKCCIIEKNKLN